ncbi:hypothetical protein [Dasania marina]|uniref:hypothetical protein n=1 Tax=Dasania marina TaxID=471499 RepID=UPI00036C2FD4|nr:hypothetical protein [Dasania marina]
MLKISQLLSPVTKIAVSETIKADMHQIIKAMPTEGVDLKALGLKGLRLDQILALYNSVYDLG